MQKFKKTWWGPEFLTSLEQIMDEGRLKRGNSYSSDYRLVKFDVNLNNVTSRVRGNKSAYFEVYETPYYDVKITFDKVAAKHWKSVLSKVGANANWVTHLILGEVPPTINEAFKNANVSLLPQSANEMRTTCSCPDWANPCKHVAGTYIRLASILDQDPIALFELRGLKRAALNRSLAKSSFGAALLSTADDTESTTVEDRDDKIATVNPSDCGIALSDLRAFWCGKAPPAESAMDRQIPPISALLLRREGDYPEFWDRKNSFLEAMTGIYDGVVKKLPKELKDY